jgi:DNA-binding NtrC family response regulator
MRELLSILFEREGYRVTVASSGEEAVAKLRELSIDLVLTDMNMPGMSGLELVRLVRSGAIPDHVDLPMVMVTAYGTTQSAIQAMKEGASDYVLKPFDNDELRIVVRKALGHQALIQENEHLKTALNQGFGEIIGTSDAMQSVYSLIRRIQDSQISCLVRGESGTGKELIARAIHNGGPRAGAPFVAVNCGAIPEGLIESELFGHRRGAFTGALRDRVGYFAAANPGTLFLDEIGEMPLSLQVKILRVLQERVVMKVGDTKTEPVDIRILAATNRDLEQEIAAGQFREDLYYRLNVVNLHLPPLRERGDDVITLAKVMLERYAKEFGSKVHGFTPGAVVAMQRYEWPGNVRQLENRLKKALVLADTALLGADDLDLGDDALEPILPLTEAREQFTRQYIMETLERNGGNRTKTARDLGVDPRTIFRYLEREPDAPAAP